MEDEQGSEQMIYLDHAATSWPKPPEVIRAIEEYYETAGGNPGRSGHRLSIAGGRIVYRTRELIAELFNAPDPMRVIFTHNATQAINLALRGLLRPGDNVVTTSIEHNAVMRPLRALEKEGVELKVVQCADDGSLDTGKLEDAVGPSAKLVLMIHASNVTGTILPVKKAAEIAHRAGALLLVDVAQTAGVLPIDVQGMGIDLLVFTGHKGLQGPMGTGGLVIGTRVDTDSFPPMLHGGTGSRSEFQEQPEHLPDKYESGTMNGAGIAGLGAGVRFVTKSGIANIHSRETELMAELLKGLRDIKGVKIYGLDGPECRTAVVSFTLSGHTVSEIGLRLDEEFGILCRVGLHCAPAAHRTTGTFPAGTVRFALGIGTTREEVRTTLDAMKKIVSS